MLLNNDYPTKSNLLIDLKKKMWTYFKERGRNNILLERYNIWNSLSSFVSIKCWNVIYLIKVEFCVRNFILTIIQWECYEDDFIIDLQYLLKITK